MKPQQDIPTTGTDWRALCEELADELTGYKVANPMHCRALLDRARTDLAQSEPEWPPMPVPGDAEGLAEVFWGRYAHCPTTIAECGGPCEQGPEHCDCGEIKADSEYTDAEWAEIQRWNKTDDTSSAPAPAGSLVERVWTALAGEFQPSGTWHDEARAAIREVAAWLMDQYTDADDCIPSEIGPVISRLREEADRG
jgi:hypothetical protein